MLPRHASLQGWPALKAPGCKGLFRLPFGAGGSADLVARMFAQHFQAKYGISVVIENKGGAGGSIGSAFVAKSSS